MLQTVIDAIPLRIYWKDRESRYRGCNAQFARDAGMASAADVIGKCDFQLAWPWQAVSDADDDREIMDSVTTKNVSDDRVTKREGRQLWLRKSKTPLIDVAGEVVGMLGFYDDITERKHTERDLQLTHAAINKSKTCVYWLSPQGQVVYANDAACASLGYARDELIGLYIWDFDPDFNPEAQARAWEAIKTQGTFTIESRHRRKDGVIFPIEVTANYIVLDEDEYSFAFVQDITERKRAARDLQLAHTAINKSKTCFHWISPRGRIIDVNDYACEVLGYTREEMVGLYIWDFTPEGLEPGWEEIKKRGSIIIEARHRRKDGTTFPVEVTFN